MSSYFSGFIFLSFDDSNTPYGLSFTETHVRFRKPSSYTDFDLGAADFLVTMKQQSAENTKIRTRRHKLKLQEQPSQSPDLNMLQRLCVRDNLKSSENSKHLQEDQKVCAGE